MSKPITLGPGGSLAGEEDCIDEFVSCAVFTVPRAPNYDRRLLTRPGLSVYLHQRRTGRTTASFQLTGHYGK